MEILCGDIFLRDLGEQDIEDIIRWNTNDNEWMDWDAPWEKDEPFDAHNYRRRKREALATPKEEPSVRREFQIYCGDCHIGWVNAYYIDDNFNYTGTGTGKLAIGIDICEPAYWNKGIGGRAFAAFIDYLFANGYEELYTQTWSGNERMIRMAERLGFSTCHRDSNVRQVRGQMHDRVTMMITPNHYRNGKMTNA